MKGTFCLLLAAEPGGVTKAEREIDAGQSAVLASEDVENEEENMKG
jgi:hypothetical protein